ncbi:MAG: hypothetical protein ACKO5J_09040, partial [Rubrivivax sp.]
AAREHLALALRLADPQERRKVMSNLAVIETDASIPLPLRTPWSLMAVDGSVAPALIEALAARAPARALEVAQALRESGQSAGSALEQMAVLLQQMAVEQAVPGSLDAADPELNAPRELAARLAPDETQLLYSIVLHGRQELSLTPDEHAGLVMTLLRFHAFVEPGGAGAGAGAASGAARPAAAALRVSAPPALAVPAPMPAPARVPLPALLSVPLPGAAPAPEAVAASGPPAPVAVAAPTPRAEPFSPNGPVAAVAPVAPIAPVPPRGAVPDPALGDRWQALVTALNASGRLSGLARELALQGALVAVGESTPGEGAPTWTIEVEHEPLRGEALADKLREAIHAELGAPVWLRVVAGAATDSPARREAAERVRRQQAAERAIHEDPGVRELLAQFPGARVVPGSVRPS